jgi:hypothetical protein
MDHSTLTGFVIHRATRKKDTFACGFDLRDLSLLTSNPNQCFESWHQALLLVCLCSQILKRWCVLREMTTSGGGSVRSWIRHEGDDVVASLGGSR